MTGRGLGLTVPVSVPSGGSQRALPLFGALVPESKRGTPSAQPSDAAGGARCVTEGAILFFLVSVRGVCAVS